MKDNYTELYSAVKSTKKTTAKGLVRELALTGLSAIANEELLRKPRVQILYIHHLFKDEEDSFNALLQYLSKHHVFISYSEAIKKILSGEIDKPYIAFSSDDGFKNNLKAAAILNRYNASACFFVNPGIIGETNYDIINKYCSETLQFPTVEFLNWNEVAQLQNEGHEIGSHTMMHMNIAEENTDAIVEDMHQTSRILRERCGDVPHFAFPYGRFFHFSKIGKKAVFDAGYKTCATAERGCHIGNGLAIANTDLCIRRDHTVLGWNINHIKYFLINNAKKASAANNYFPESIR